MLYINHRLEIVDRRHTAPELTPNQFPLNACGTIYTKVLIALKAAQRRTDQGSVTEVRWFYK
jgi:hypothetical protein